MFEYALAIAKEILGYIRGKYSTIPIPDARCNLKPSRFNMQQQHAEKNALIERLRAYFDETSRQSLLERRSNEAGFLQTELNNVPSILFL